MHIKNLIINHYLLLFILLLFIASCGGGGGGSPTPPTPSPTVTISSSASTVIINETVTLTWSSTNSTSCSASGSWTGSKATSGNEDVTIASTGSNNFSLSCTGEGGSSSASVTVTGINFNFSNSSHVTDEDTSITEAFNISSGASTISYSTSQAPSNGSVSYSSPDNSFTYVPDNDWFGSDSFSVSASTQGITQTATISISVNSINDSPVMNLTQLQNNEGDSLYPLALTDSNNQLEIDLYFSDIDTDLDQLSVSATTPDGESASIIYNNGATVSTLDLTDIKAGPTDLTISVSDGEATVSDVLQIWVTAYIAIDNESNPGDGNRAYTIFGNHNDSDRATNYVIISDALPDNERVLGFRSVIKRWINLINQTELSSIMSNYFSIGVIETALSSESAIGTATGCDSRDENIYCYTEDWRVALQTLQDQYFLNVDSRSVITGIGGRGVANLDWKVNIQNIPNVTDSTIRSVISTLKHEFGHSYSILQDEYTTTEVNCTDYNCSWIEIGPNTTAEDEPEKVRWNHHIEDLNNIPGYHDTTATEGIGYYKGVYWGIEHGYRPSFETIMNGYPSNWIMNGEITKEILWDKIGIEAFVIQALKYQGMHSIDATFDANNDLVISHSFVDPAGLFEVEWYLNGEKIENNSNSYVLARKSSGYEHVSYRIKEKTQNLLTVTDNILDFNDVYSGIFSGSDAWYCPNPLNSIAGYQTPICRNSLKIKWTNYSGLYNYFFYENIGALQSSGEANDYGLQYWIDYSGLGAQFGINWEAN